MYNIKFIRENLSLFTKKLNDRNVNINFDEFLKLDKKNRELIQKKEKLEQEKKALSQQKDKTLFIKSKEIGQKTLSKKNIERRCFR